MIDQSHFFGVNPVHTSYVSRFFVISSAYKGWSIWPLMTARMTNRRTGTAISRIVMNQWRRFRSRFFQRSTKNFEKVLILGFLHLNNYSWYWLQNMQAGDQDEMGTKIVFLSSVSSTTALSCSDLLSLPEKLQHPRVLSAKRNVTPSLVMTMKMTNRVYGFYVENKSTHS